MKVTKIEYENVVVTVHDPQSKSQREMLEKACTDFIKAVQNKKSTLNRPKLSAN